MGRFLLRSLLIVMFVFAIVAGWVGNSYHRQQLRERDEQALAGLGAVFDENLSSVRHFNGLGVRGSERPSPERRGLRRREAELRAEVLRTAWIVNPEILVTGRRFFSLQPNVLLNHFVRHIAGYCHEVPPSPHMPTAKLPVQIVTIVQ
jgi:hypothetical protein